jgi:hypothetical protein
MSNCSSLWDMVDFYVLDTTMELSPNAACSKWKRHGKNACCAASICSKPLLKCFMFQLWDIEERRVEHPHGISSIVKVQKICIWAKNEVPCPCFEEFKRDFTHPHGVFLSPKFEKPYMSKWKCESHNAWVFRLKCEPVWFGLDVIELWGINTLIAIYCLSYTTLLLYKPCVKDSGSKRHGRASAVRGFVK